MSIGTGNSRGAVTQADERGSAAVRTRAARRHYTTEDRQHALAVIGQCGGNLTKAAARLGVGVPLLSRWRTQAVRTARGATG